MASESGKKLALIVDDDPDVVETIEAAMSAHLPEYEIDTTGNGCKAVEKWRVRKHSLIILDMMLPGQSGFLVIEKVLENFRTGPTRKPNWDERPVIIMITGNTSGRHKIYAEVLGTDAYLLKPVRMNALVAVIKEKVKRQT